MKISAATMPTNIAAINSIESIKRSMGPRGAGFSTAPARGASLVAAMLGLFLRSIRGVVPVERRLQFLHDGIGIAAWLAHAVGPDLDQRLGRLLPFAELLARESVDLVA